MVPCVRFFQTVRKMRCDNRFDLTEDEARELIGRTHDPAQRFLARLQRRRDPLQRCGGALAPADAAAQDPPWRGLTGGPNPAARTAAQRYFEQESRGYGGKLTQV